MSEAPERSVEETVRYELSGGVGWITLDRPEALNAIDANQRNRLVALLQEASSDPEVRVLVLTATGRGFCTGADLRSNSGRSAARLADPRPGDVARTIRDGAQTLIVAVLDCEKPVIAAVNGIAAGLGAHLALACDLVLAAESAKFIEIFARRGLVPDGGGAYLLTRLVGTHKAKELVYFGDDVLAAEALALGLVNRVVRAWAERLAVGPTRMYSLAKNLINHALETDRTTAFREEADAVELNMATEDGKEGVRAFGERRAPEFKGR